MGYDTVEAIAEGERDKVERFIEMMNQDPIVSRVDECTVEWEEITGEFGMRRSL